MKNIVAIAMLSLNIGSASAQVDKKISCRLFEMINNDFSSQRLIESKEQDFYRYDMTLTDPASGVRANIHQFDESPTELVIEEIADASSTKAATSISRLTDYAWIFLSISETLKMSVNCTLK